MTRDGYTFDGWYYDEEFIFQFNPKDEIVRDTTFYGKWEPALHTVTLVTNNEEDDTTLEVSHGETLPYIAPPVKERHEFEGWYNDLELTDEFDVNDDTVDSDKTLYAKHELVIGQVTLKLNNGDPDEHLTVGLGGWILEPSTPFKDGYAFVGWFELEGDDNFVPYNFDDPINEDKTVYALWEEDNSIFIGANIYTYNDNFMNGIVRPELERYAEEMGARLELLDSEGDQARLNDQVDMFITQGADVLIIQLVDPAAAGHIISKAKAADIPLILYMLDPNM